MILTIATHLAAFVLGAVAYKFRATLIPWLKKEGESLGAQAEALAKKK